MYARYRQECRIQTGTEARTGTQEWARTQEVTGTKEWTGTLRNSQEHLNMDKKAGYK